MVLDRPIATGMTAEIYTWREGYVLKLFNQGMVQTTVENEANLTRLIHKTGLPVPEVGELIEVNSRYGFELERLDGSSMLEELTNKPWRLIANARQLAQLHAEMHKHEVPGLPAMRERLTSKLNRAAILPEDIRQAALEALEDLPRDDKLCHGDFHPGNIQLTKLGPVIIDWLDAASGSPLLDVTRSSLLFGGGRLPQSIRGAWFLNIMQRRFYMTYLKRYLKQNPIEIQDIQKWLPVIAAARLSENIKYDEARLLSIAHNLVR